MLSLVRLLGSWLCNRSRRGCRSRWTDRKWGQVLLGLLIFIRRWPSFLYWSFLGWKERQKLMCRYLSRSHPRLVSVWLAMRIGLRLMIVPGRPEGPWGGAEFLRLIFTAMKYRSIACYSLLLLRYHLPPLHSLSEGLPLLSDAFSDTAHQTCSEAAFHQTPKPSISSSPCTAEPYTAVQSDAQSGCHGHQWEHSPHSS